MRKFEIFTIIAIIISLLALISSLYNGLALNNANARIIQLEERLMKADAAVAEFEKLEPNFKVINQFLPKIEQFLISLPPTVSD